MTKWRMMCCRYCGKDQGGLAGIFEARDRGEEIERFVGPEMGACDCDQNPYTPIYDGPDPNIGRMVLKTSLQPKATVIESEWDVL